MSSSDSDTRARMNLSQEVDDYIKDTIDHSLGLPISIESLQKKLLASEESHLRLRDQYLLLLSRLKEKDQVLDRVRSEASLNAQALKKFVEENQKLAEECGNLLSQCKKWERECLLYHQDRDALMEFGNEADERAREAESRVRQLEEEVARMSEELRLRKPQIGSEQVDNNCTALEEDLLDSVLGSLISKDENIVGRLFLEANIQDQSCQALLSKWDQLKPSTQKVLSLVSVAKKFEKERECIIQNLAKAEQEAELVSKQNRKLDKENRKLLRQQQSPLGSAEKSHKSASAKSNKRKCPKMMSSPIEKMLEFSGSPEISRKPLSPVWDNSADSRMNKK
ncbi:Uncharacterized protein Rs2_09558 [Raphanus sativus]|uniref:Uncharacterized protein LOC108846152 n=1 Tax=Raphanus sativus TaxID=3726 RepID=A0A6J0MTJ2_RAPSA|nr:uncharacterized protein LOC108846152 [Raphanus sativus]KAJ4905900.1 Uncharacterized protein Rs2_09558 [Raphanus sativus]